MLTNHPSVLGGGSGGGSGGGAGSVIVKDEGSTILTATTLNFTGTSVSVTDGGGGTATIDVSGGGTSYTEVLAHANLPITIGTPAVGTVYLVKTSTGAWYTFDKKEKGLWRRIADAGTLADWTHLGDAAELTVDTTFAIGDDGDNTKKLMFSTGGGTTATTLTLATAQTANRTVTLPDATDTLVGRDTADTLTNKSIVATQLTGIIADARMPDLTGDVTTTEGAVATTVGKINGVSMAGLATGILKNTTTTGVPSIAVAGDFPTLNQSTTGSAATLTTPRAIYGNNFDGSAALAQVIASTYGGTGNGFAKLSGPATTEKTFTLPNASAAILTDNAAVTGAQGGTGVANSGKTITLGGSLTTSGAFDTTLTVTAATGVTLPTTGTLATLAGAETLSNKTLVAPALGTPASGTLTNCTGLPVAGGGTGVATLTAYAPVFGGTTGTGAVQSGTVGTSGQVLTSNGAGALPTFQAAAGGGSGTKTYAVFTPLDNQPPASNYATFDTRNSIAVLDFDDSTEESATFVDSMVEAASLGSGLKVRIKWAATTATTGDARWGVQIMALNATTDIDADSYDTAAEATTTAPGTSGYTATTEITITTIDSLAAGESYRLKVYRDTTGADTITGDLEIHSVEVRSAA